MAKVFRYKGSDGRVHDVNEGSVAQKLAAADGAFEFVGEVLEDGTIAIVVAEAAAAGGGEERSMDWSKLSRDVLIAEAAKLGIAFDAADKAQTKKVIIAAIEAKLAEDAAAK